jgi:hypothetical protein
MYASTPIASQPYGWAPLGVWQPFAAMSAARKRNAVVPEVVQGTIPAAPAFMVLRDSFIESAVDRPDIASLERRSDRSTGAMSTGLVGFQKTIEMPWVRDAATDVLWESAFCAAFAGNVLKNASTRRPFVLEEAYDATPSPVHRRTAGCVVDEAAIALKVGTVGGARFRVRGLHEDADYYPLVGASYADPTPALDPVTPAEIVAENLFSLRAPRVTSLTLWIRNNVKDKHGFGSAEPWGTGMGAFVVMGQVELTLTDFQEYVRFMRRQRGLGMSLVLGTVGGARDRLQMTNVDVWGPEISDREGDADHTVTLNFLARRSAADAAVAVLTRNI